MPPELNVCISEVGKAATLKPTVQYFQQMSLFTGLKASLPHSENPSCSYSSHRYAWFSFICYKKRERVGKKIDLVTREGWGQMTFICSTDELRDAKAKPLAEIKYVN